MTQHEVLNYLKNVDALLNTGIDDPEHMRRLWALKISTKRRLFGLSQSTLPKTVCLCGSTRFKQQYEEAQREFTLRGTVVLSVGMFGHVEGLDMNGDAKKMLDELHLRKIDMSDFIFVINVGGYVGESTAREIAYAKKLGKPVHYLEQDCAEECKEGDSE